ncbi:hypothetical protein KGQ19_29305 [Catenulispora sp. NL8]|uniref:LppP/LprE lipoprotein n=1 Tax=Catenulispora pinistramenti TaxID=2705254 RepID=A0ABS5KY40_9ACTN|nr:hypothetical protein [Catenulispora pinistramenti]MBS2550977.1 hypothetical protein [Catenulispora pinistramenti]
MMRSRISTAAVAAIAASLVAGLGACSSTSKAAGGGSTAAPSTSATAPAGGAGTSSPTGDGSPSAGSPSTGSPSTGSTSAFTAAQLEAMRAKVASAFGQGVTAPPHYDQPTVNTTELAADFDSPATMNASWGTGPVGSERPMDCGTAKYDGIVIGAVRASGSNATVPVMLYENNKAGAVEVTVTVDPASGVIKGTACGGAPSPTDFPGIAPIATYYGAVLTDDQSVVDNKSHPYFTSAFAAWTGDGDYNTDECGQNGPDRWIVALTGTTSAASTWDFAPGAVMTLPDPTVPAMRTGFTSALAVDLGSAKISRVTCGRAYPPVLGSNTKPADYAQQLLDYYRVAAQQKSLGVDAEAAIRPFFVSDAAFTKAWGSTGTVPLLCTKKVPLSVMMADGTSLTTSGTQSTLHMVTWPDWHPDAPGQEASKFTAVFDTKTMKISSITCS